MLDVRFIRKNADKVQKSADAKGYKINLSEILRLDQEKRTIQGVIDEKRQARNSLAQKNKGQRPSEDDIKLGKNLKAELSQLEDKLKTINKDLSNFIAEVPNIIFDDVPLGGESDSVAVKEWGNKKPEGVDHLDYAIKRNWVDFERGAKVAGTKFYYIKNELALIENALLQFGIDKVIKSGFNYMTVPHMVNSRVFAGTGFAPRTNEQSDEYFIEQTDLGLIATAEMPLTGYHMDEILDESDLPLLYAGYSPCYRKEAGAAGKHTRGLFRVHQFNKLEMYAFTLPEQSLDVHEKIRAVEEEIWQDLGIAYRVVNIAAGDLGAPAAKKYDIEYWSPADQTYRELTSCSNCTDFQANTTNIRVRRVNGSVEMVHTLNGTAISFARTMVALVENYAEADGKLRVPTKLQPYLNGKKEL